MNPIDFVRSLNKCSRKEHERDARVVNLIAGPLAKAFPEISPKAVWQIWQSRKDEAGFRHELENGEIHGLPAWVRIDERKGVELHDLVMRPLACGAVADLIERCVGAKGEPFATVFQVLRRGEWVAHNLRLERADNTVRVDIMNGGCRVVVQPIKCFIKERSLTKQGETEV